MKIPELKLIFMKQQYELIGKFAKQKRLFIKI